jgi:hypothetical protein
MLGIITLIPLFHTRHNSQEEWWRLNRWGPDRGHVTTWHFTPGCLWAFLGLISPQECRGEAELAACAPSNVWGDILKAKSEIRNQCQQCHNGSFKQKQRKPVNEDLNEIAWQWFVSMRAKHFWILYMDQLGRNMQKKWQKAVKKWLKASTGLL